MPDARIQIGEVSFRVPSVGVLVRNRPGNWRVRAKTSFAVPSLTVNIRTDSQRRITAEIVNLGIPSIEATVRTAPVIITNAGQLFFQHTANLVDGRCFPVAQIGGGAGKYPSIVYRVIGDDGIATFRGLVVTKEYLLYEVRSEDYAECVELDRLIIARLTKENRIGSSRRHVDRYDEKLKFWTKSRNIGLRL